MKDKSVSMDSLRLGVCYYPEHWDRSMWADDLQRMKKYGISIIRVFEFAWTFAEPSEGVYTFDLFDDFLQTAKENGMRIIFCTPTATPPAWLTEKYPDVLNAKKSGELFRHGHRRHYNYNSETYLTFTEQIVTKLAERYQNEECIIGWQIDNEINAEINEFYSESDHKAFREYLKNRFVTLDALNDAIGSSFWNQTFTDWSQVTMERETPSGHGNPHLALLEKEFFSESANRYVALQSSILRKNIKHAFITTNGIFNHIDNVRMTQESLDFMCYDSYPNMAYEYMPENQPAQPLLRDRLWSKHLACARELSPNFGVMEQQSGAHGWDFCMESPMPRPGQLRLWTYQSIANGADFICFYRWRTCRFGTEIYWHGLNDYSNTNNRRLQELHQIAAEIDKLPEIAGSRYIAKAAIATDYLNEWDGERDKWHGPLDRLSQINIFSGAQMNHTPIDTIHLTEMTTVDQLMPYTVIFYPHASILPKERADLLKAYLQRGGHLIMGARTGYKDIYGHCISSPMPGHASTLCGVQVTDYTFAHPDEPPVQIEAFGTKIDAPVFYDILKPTEDGQVIGIFKGSYFTGLPAIIKKEYESGGSAFYIGSGISQHMAEILLDELRCLSPFNHIVTPSAAIELTIRQKKDKLYIFLLNYSKSIEEYTINRPCTNMLTGLQESGLHRLPGYGVAIYETMID